ncbi:hypothetical protein AAHE18_14G117000 [Arachis hypogaea]
MLLLFQSAFCIILSKHAAATSISILQYALIKWLKIEDEGAIFFRKQHVQ